MVIKIGSSIRHMLSEVARRRIACVIAQHVNRQLGSAIGGCETFALPLVGRAGWDGLMESPCG